MTDKELEKYIIDRYAAVQTGFDTAKATMITAGLLVAISLYKVELSTAHIAGMSALKVVLVLTMVSAIAFVLSFIFAEYQSHRHDKLVGNTGFNWWEKVFLTKNPRKRVSILAWYYVRFLDSLTRYANNIATTALLLALVSFLYAAMQL